jgi:hypothetical protein
LSALEHVRAVDAVRQRFPVFARVTMSSPTADKLHSFGAFFAEGTMCFRTDGRIPRAARRVIRPCVGTSGFEGSAGNLKLSAGNAQTKHSFRSMRILSALISQEECQGVRGISRPACIPCYPTRLVGFWSPILTRRHGGGTLARSVILPDRTESQLPSNNPARGMLWAYLSTVARLSQTELPGSHAFSVPHGKCRCRTLGEVRTNRVP